MPPDEGKPAHKASPRHTLDEVIQSLNDLLRNELANAQALPGDSPIPLIEVPDGLAGRRQPASPPSNPTRDTHKPVPDLPPLPAEPTKSPGGSVAGPKDEWGDWDDIPILYETVEQKPASPPVPAPPAPEPDAHAPASGPRQAEAPLPTPNRARAIAIQAVAHLNRELKQAGKRTLGSDITIRLAQLLQDEIRSSEEWGFPDGQG